MVSEEPELMVRTEEVEGPNITAKPVTAISTFAFSLMALNTLVNI